ncbi:MAG: ATP-binding protein [Candidatus Cryptobacteroides sp.]
MTSASKIYPALTLDVMASREEGQYYDVKSAQKKPSELADIVSAYANAEGGTVVIGISDKTRRVEGVNAQGAEKINNFLNIPKDCCVPMPEYRHEMVDVTNDAGKPDRLILLHIKPSIDRVIRTTKDEVFLRIGDKTRKLTVEEIRQLEYEKGVAHYEEEVCQYATMDDLESELLDSYRQKIGAVHQSNEQVLRARQFIVKRHGEDMLTNAAVLLFGKNVRGFFPHCRIRYIKVNGTAMRTGADFNVVKDRSFDLPLLRLIPETKRFISDQLEERTTLEADGRFHTYPEYPEFAWVESITNAVCHRQWGLRGDYILVAKYDDRLEIKSPGRLPNIVTVDNIFTTRFARNPIISRILTEMELVRELNEGVPRIFSEMKEAGLPEPEIVERAANVTVVLYNGKRASAADNSTDNHLSENLSENLSVTQQKVLKMIQEKTYTNASKAAETLHISRNSVNAAISALKEKGFIVRIGEDKGGHWEVNTK